MRKLLCAIYTQTMLRKKNIAKKEGYSCAQNIADYLRIVLDYCLLGMHVFIICIYYIKRVYIYRPFLLK